MTVNTHPEGVAPNYHEDGQRQSLEPLWHALNDLTELERELISRWYTGVPATDTVKLGGPTGPQEFTLIGPSATQRFQGCAIWNTAGVPVQLAFAAGAAVGNTPYTCPPRSLTVVPVNFQDLSVALANPDVAAGAKVTVGRLRIAPFAPAVYPLAPAAADTLAATGTVNAPGAATIICQIPAPPAGVYSLRTLTWETGTVDGTPLNMTLTAAAAVAGLPSTAAPISTTIERVTVDGTAPLTVRAAVNAGAGSVYQAQLLASRIA